MYFSVVIFFKSKIFLIVFFGQMIVLVNGASFFWKWVFKRVVPRSLSSSHLFLLLLPSLTLNETRPSFCVLNVILRWLCCSVCIESVRSGVTFQERHFLKERQSGRVFEGTRTAEL